MAYKCSQCGKEIVINQGDPVRCPFCGFKIIFKTRPKVVKKIKPQ